MSELPERLRDEAIACQALGWAMAPFLLREASAEIERLERERDEARAALMAWHQAQGEISRIENEKAHASPPAPAVGHPSDAIEYLRAGPGTVIRGSYRGPSPPPAPAVNVETLRCAMMVLHETADCGKLVRALRDMIRDIEAASPPAPAVEEESLESMALEEIQEALTDAAQSVGLDPDGLDDLAVIRSLARRAASPPAPAGPTKARMACLRDEKIHIFTTDTAAREWLVEHGNDWSFAGWIEGIEWHPAGPAATGEGVKP